MRIKRLFTVADGEKVTEKVFGRVLVSSICSILLCMACLFGTTWAWFTVSIVSEDNVIEIADLDVTVSITNQETPVTEQDGKYQLEAGKFYRIEALVTRGAENRILQGDGKVAANVLMIVEETDQVYYCPESLVVEELTVSESITVRFAVSWSIPKDAFHVEGQALTISDQTTDPTGTTTETNPETTTETTTEATTETTTEKTADTTAATGADPSDNAVDNTSAPEMDSTDGTTQTTTPSDVDSDEDTTQAVTVPEESTIPPAE